MKVLCKSLSYWDRMVLDNINIDYEFLLTMDLFHKYLTGFFVPAFSHKIPTMSFLNGLFGHIYSIYWYTHNIRTNTTNDNAILQTQEMRHINIEQEHKF